MKTTLLILSFILLNCSNARGQLKIDVFPEVGITSNRLKDKVVHRQYDERFYTTTTESSKKNLLVGGGLQLEYKKHWQLQLGLQYQSKQENWENYRERTRAFTDISLEKKEFRFNKICAPILVGYSFHLKKLIINPQLGVRLNYFTKANIATSIDYGSSPSDVEFDTENNYDPLANNYSFMGARFKEFIIQKSVGANINLKHWQLSAQYHFNFSQYNIMEEPLTPLQDVIESDNFKNNDFVLSLRYLILIKEVKEQSNFIGHFK